MWHFMIKYRRSVGPLILLALLFFNEPLYPQQKNNIDSILSSQPEKIRNLPGSSTLIVNGNPGIPESLIPFNAQNDKQTTILLDSLKIKASKYLLTKKLYSLLIVSSGPSSQKNISKSSEADYLQYSGKRIRNIEIQRLDVFGSNIYNPLISNPNKIENILNKTHLNTNEFIIRKNLLFSEGDTISPLRLSDNERILRTLPFINDSRIVVIPVSDDEADIVVITRDVYSLGASIDYSSLRKGTVSIFEKNLLGLGHEFRLDMPFDANLPDSPGFGLSYKVDNISKSFINMNIFYFNGLGRKNYGFSLDRKLISYTTKYGGGISISEMFTTEDLGTLPVPEPLKYNLQDYWLSRSFLLNKEKVTRLIFGARYTNNNVFDHPFILPDSYFNLQQYKMFLGSAAISIQKYYKTNLIYGYGRTEDIPYGGLLNLTIGREINEFKYRFYTGINLSAGQSIKSIGYLYFSTGFSTFLHDGITEQGLLQLRTNFFSNLLYLGNYRIRNFIKVDYTRGFDRYSDEYITFRHENGFSGFSNDTIKGTQRLTVSLESVFFSPKYFYGFRFAFFAFADLGYLSGTNEMVSVGGVLSGVGLGLRIRNDNLVFNTLQIRLGFYPNLPQFSKVNYLDISGEQMLKPDNFDPGPPSILTYR
jgi:hypothetical protein